LQAQVTVLVTGSQPASRPPVLFLIYDKTLVASKTIVLLS